MGMPEIKNSGISRSQAITDIIESIALEQTALSHILNAEGEKIQKVVALSAVPNDVLYMLETNKSVKHMVNSITRLEVLLQTKLELFSECLCQEDA
ncbi:hypothetical protein [Anaerotignum sp.]|uniref:hypothetical protein n=1 Tax=Anaerotignum sp. TaxID=2039241 RepID=UPI00332720E3